MKTPAKKGTVLKEIFIHFAAKTNVLANLEGKETDVLEEIPPLCPKCQKQVRRNLN